MSNLHKILQLDESVEVFAQYFPDNDFRNLLGAEIYKVHDFVESDGIEPYAVQLIDHLGFIMPKDYYMQQFAFFNVYLN